MTKRGKIIGYIVAGVAAIGVAFVAVLILFVGLLHWSPHRAFTDMRVYLVVAAVLIGVVLVAVIDTRIRGSKRVLKVNKDLEDAHFLTRREIKRADGYTVIPFAELGEVADGIPVRAELTERRQEIVLRDPIHTMVIGSTGTGKTSAFVSPVVEILSRTKTKPCLVITDPKGELFEKHAASLKQSGYEICVIDLIDIFHSTRWNPLADVLRKTERMRHARVENLRGKYYVDGTPYLSCKEAEQAVQELTVELESEIYVDLQDLVYAMCAIESKSEPGWERGARDFIFAVVLAFWEDVRDGFMPAEKFTLFNLYKTITEYASGDCAVFKEYVQTRDLKSKVRGLSNTVLVSEDRTLASYLGEVNKFVTWLADGGITALTSGNDVDFGAFDEQPTALFLKVPDERENRYKMVSLFVVQMYKALVDKARRNAKTGKVQGDARLLRHTYFLLDEFGNMPRMHNLDKVVTVGRSRGIYLVPVIQDFSQLNNRYGKEVADTIRSNCNIQIFIGTNDKATREIFSEQCGKKKVRQVSYSEKDDMSVSTSAQSVPLIYPSELERLNDPASGVFGNCIALVLGNYPMKSKFTPYFLAKSQYGEKKTSPAPKEFICFDEEKAYYDIRKTTVFLQQDGARQITEEEEREDQTEQPLSDRVLADKSPPDKMPKMTAMLRKKIAQKIEKLGKWLPIGTVTRLQDSALEEQLRLITDLGKTDGTEKFLLWDLAALKCDIENLINIEHKEKEAVAK